MRIEYILIFFKGFRIRVDILAGQALGGEEWVYNNAFILVLNDQVPAANVENMNSIFAVPAFSSW